MERLVEWTAVERLVEWTVAERGWWSGLWWREAGRLMEWMTWTVQDLLVDMAVDLGMGKGLLRLYLTSILKWQLIWMLR